LPGPGGAGSVWAAQRRGVVAPISLLRGDKAMTIPVPHITIENTWIDIWKDIDVSATFDVNVRQNFVLNELVNVDKNIDIDAWVDLHVNLDGNFAMADVKVETADDPHFNWQVGAITTSTSSVSQLVGQDSLVIPIPGHDPWQVDFPKFAAVAQAPGHDTFTELTAVVEIFDTGGSFVNVILQSVTD
jgi:hypothetical protein